MTKAAPHHIGPFEAVEHLFALWLPRWRLAVVYGEAPWSDEEEWTAAPSLAKVLDYGAFPLTFAGPDGRRHPVSVERFDIDDPDETSDSPLHASWGLPDAGAEQAFTLLIEAMESGPGGLDRRGRALAGYLAGYLTADGTDLLRITVAAELGGPALDDELHLLVRSGKTTTRLALVLAPTPNVPHANDAPEYRITCVTTLLSEFLRINNTDAVTFEVTFGTHDIDLNVADPDAAFRSGWAGDEHWLIAEEGDDETDDVLWALDAASLKAALTESELNIVAVARARTLVWEFDSTTPEIPGDELVSWLARDLLETIATETTGAPGLPPVLAYAKNFPLESVLDGEGDSCLLLVGAERTALIHISG
ncbi:hypothetical protein GCM10022225_39140 [Plantactinospora mayteni]|uniref:Uncharacterized protein n=1 Tax=Plantactinospora mayteni TaxID=566021 RepID=A0ABQ4EWL4_9ACTN|nr:hypothetical protein [Plantactinospora mayteni]GIG99067.1 hypothetical protein Pma05_56400 [Plantactinospora mayteni]